MAQQDNDKRIVYCIAERQNSRDTDQGLLKPIFEETIDGLVSASSDTYVNNGSIHVTKGYSKFANSQDGQFFRVEASVSRSWDENDSHDGISKYVTYDKLSEPSKYLDVCLLLDAEYPKPSELEGMVCEVTQLPIDGFFIRCVSPEGKKVIVGPLDVSRDSIRQEDGMYFFKYKAPDRPFGGDWKRINTAPHSSLVFDYDLIPNRTIASASNGNNYLINSSNLPHTSAYQIDLSSDDNIIKWASKLFRTANPDLSNQLSKLKDLVENIPPDSSIPLDIFESRKERLQNFPERWSQIEGFDQILADYLRNSEGQKVIKQYVDTNRVALLDKYFNEVLEKELEKVRESSEKEISEKKQHIRNLISEIDELENKKVGLESSKIGIELEDMKQEIKSLRLERDIIHDVDKLETLKELLTKDIEKLQTKKINAEAQLEDVRESFNKSDKAHKVNLIKLKTEFDAIFGNIKTTNELKTAILTTSSLTHINNEGDYAKLDVIKTLTNNLAKRGRIVTQDDIAILLTCTMQNLIVTLAGKPGSGKSSTVNELAHVLGIKKENKYAHVQVQRGWSSNRDLLGFENKLSHSYEPDGFGVYKLINGLQEIPSKHQFSIILLDEANLSPIEHYWAAFMDACNNADSFSLSGVKSEQSLKLPKGLRFIATVNYDRMTEPLSARFLDRSPIIYLESSINSLLDFDREFISNQETDENITCYSFDDLETLFGKNTSAINFKPDEERIIKEILQEHRFLDIKYRKITAISNFTETLRYVLSEDKSETLKAFDYALLIYVLPLINGQGRNYKEAVEKFSKYLSSQQVLTRSSDRLNTIIKNSQFDAYSYFS